MKGFKVGSLLLLLVLISFSTAVATPVPIENASFEMAVGTLRGAPTFKYGPWYLGSGTTGLPGWTYSGDGIYGNWSPSGPWYSENVPDGNYIGLLNSGSLFQQLDWTVSVNTLLTLSIDIGNRMDVTFPSYAVELWAGDTLLVSDGSVLPGEGLFSNLTMNYAVLENDLGIGKNLGIKIVSNGAQLNFDNVHLTNDPNPVPEPATMILLGAGLMGLAGFGRKRLRK